MSTYLDYAHEILYKQTPESLAGYQLIETGMVKQWDLLIPIESTGSSEWEWAGGWINSLVESVVGYRVYRKMPCPHAGDYDKVPGTDKTYGEVRAMEDVAEDRPVALTFDDGKPALANLPWKALRRVAAVQSYGHKKYGDFNNYRKGMEVTRQASCVMRHLAAFLDGEDNDPESGLPHVDHAATRLLFLLQNLAEGKAIDDRFKP